MSFKKDILDLIRIKHWTKNLFLFAAIVFAKKLFYFSYLQKVILGFFAFCFISSAVYIINDISDIEYDRFHPIKKHRPIPSGKVKTSSAILISIFLLIAGLTLSYIVKLSFLTISFIYFSLMISYSLFLKHLIIIDVMIVAFGFVLRVIAGAIAIGVEISSWIIICTTFLSLFLAMCKRRAEISLSSNSTSRKVLKSYTPYLLDQMIAVVTSSTIISYALYTTSEETIRKFGSRNLMYTLAFVIFGIFRYLYLVHKRNLGENPEEIILKDKPMIFNLLLYIICVIVIIYF